MIPKDKAIQLVQRFYFSLPNNGSETGVCNIHQRWEEGKQCAQIAVDEILEQLNHLPTQGYGMEYQDVINYWKEVKQEIERL